MLATVDSALGLGGGALLADICRTLLDGESEMGGGMGDMPMEIKPLPLIMLSMAATGAAIYALAHDQNRILAGQSEPDDAERASILSAMLVVAVAQGHTTRDEFRDVFRIATGHNLSDELLALAYARFNDLLDDSSDRNDLRVPPVATTIGRRRSLAAALMIGCVARKPSDEVSAVLEQMALDIGATSDDVTVARRALSEWQKGCAPMNGVSPVTILRHRNLRLKSA